jgi:hypothetical protein
VKLAGTGIYGPLIGTLPEKKTKITNVDLQPWFQKDQRTGQRTYPEPPDVCRYSHKTPWFLSTFFKTLEPDVHYFILKIFKTPKLEVI